MHAERRDDRGDAQVDPKFFTTREIARIFRVTRATAVRWCQEGTRFPGAFQAGRPWLVPESDVLALTNRPSGSTR
jgi:predicted site-specific integrase-resolvase